MSTIKRFNKEFPCNKSNVEKGDLVWVTERVDGVPMHSLGRVTAVYNAGINVEVKTSAGFDHEFMFGINGTRAHSRFGNTLRVAPATRENDAIFARKIEQQDAYKRAINKLDAIRNLDESQDWNAIAAILDQIEI